jgi:NAD(P)-dependent dehydrogenase (short-subunit alcohol dehydrogenase family)
MKTGLRFEGKGVMVTGSASGIGRPSALAFAAEGASVACLDFDRPGAKDSVSLIEKGGGTASYFHVDVTDAESIRTATEDAVDYLGRLDVVHHNAGANGYGPIHEMPIETWDHIFAVNTRGAFIAMKYQIPHLLAGGGGAIVLTGSVIRHASRPNAAAYAAASWHSRVWQNLRRSTTANRDSESTSSLRGRSTHRWSARHSGYPKTKRHGPRFATSGSVITCQA